MGRRSPGNPGSPRSRPSLGAGGVSLLLSFGFGYTAQHYAALYGARYDRIAGTTRSAANAAAPAARQFGGRAVDMMVFDATQATAEPALEQSARPRENGDPASPPHLLDSRVPPAFARGNERKST